ncbi:MAG TPA: hypothetical protein VD813_15535 [Pseudonocardia sp.]|nr:hypothetical protein [Pseudonocardia sp.]
MTAGDTAPLRATLDRAVAAGIVTREQAAAIAALEPGTDTGRVHDGGRRAVLAEVLGYVGGALALVAALLLGQQLWADLDAVVRVLLLGGVAALALWAGAVLGDRGGASGRLGGFLWAAAVVAVGGAAGVAAADLLDAPTETAVLVAALGALAVAVVLWWRRREVLQHVAAFGAAVFTLLAVLGQVDDSTYRFAGALVWALGVAWVAASAAGRLPPAPTGWVLGSAAAVVGPMAADAGRAAWLVVGVLTAAAVVVVGVRMRRPWLLPIGVGALFVSVPLTIAEVFDTELGPLVGVLVVGLLLVGAAVVLTRRAGRSRG